jgi:hypothetical protein
LAIVVNDEEDESIRSRVPDIFEVKESAPNLFDVAGVYQRVLGPASMVAIGPKSNSNGCGMSYVLDEESAVFSLAHFFDPAYRRIRKATSVLRRRIQTEAV